MKFFIKPEFRNVVRARAGASDRLSSGHLYLDRNERAEPFSDTFRQGLARRLAEVPLNQYPELGPIYEKVAAWLGIDVEELFFTEGVSGAIKSILETIGRPGGNIVFPNPGFALYPVYAQMYGQASRALEYGENYHVSVEDYLGAIDENTSAVFLPNPNVPLGGYHPPDEVISLARACEARGTVLVVDEVYYPFGGEGAIPLIGKHPNVLVARSFSKAFGAAGLRFGYLAGPKGLVGEVSKSRSGYELNALSIETASFFLDHEEEIHAHIAAVSAGMEGAVARLRGAGLKVVSEGSGNFFFIDLNDAELAQEIAGRLSERNIHVRGGWAVPWDRGLQVSGAGPELMTRFADAFLDIWRDCRRP